MDEAQHRELANVLNACCGQVALSGYDHPLMEELYPQDHWVKTWGPERTIHSTKGVRREMLWTNYDPATIKPKQSL
jgi:DNA adenine methylase